MQKTKPPCETDLATKIEKEMDQFLEKSEKGRSQYTCTWDISINSTTCQHIKTNYANVGWLVEINSEKTPPKTVLTLKQQIIVEIPMASSFTIPPGHREIYTEHEKRSSPHSNAPQLPGE